MSKESTYLPLDRREVAMEERGPLDSDGVALRASFFFLVLEDGFDTLILMVYSNPGTLGWFINYSWSGAEPWLVF